jgi:hypothetical protein
MDLLIERRMSYTLPLNKIDLLLNSGLAILWQSLDLEEESKLVKDNQKSLICLTTMIQNESPIVASEFQKMAATFVTLDARPVLSPKSMSPDTAQRPSPIRTAVSDPKSKSARKQLQAIASKWSSFNNKTRDEECVRRATVPQTTPAPQMQPHRAASTTSLSSTRSAPAMAAAVAAAAPNPLAPCRSVDNPMINLDYLPMGDEFGDSQTRTSSSTMLPPKQQATSTTSDSNWDTLLNNFDNSCGLYPDMNANGLYQVPSNEWTPDVWNLTGMEFASKAPVPQSLLSFSEESLTSGDDFLFSAPPSNSGSAATGEAIDLTEHYGGITIPVDDEFDVHEIEA